jgi:hypothetical protein
LILCYLILNGAKAGAPKHHSGQIATERTGAFGPSAGAKLCMPMDD